MFNRDRRVVFGIQVPRIKIQAGKSFVRMIGVAAVAFFAGCAGSGQSSSQRTIHVMSYNIHHGVGTDSTFDISRIADVIRKSDADIVALQDVDRWVYRTGKMDLMTKLADLTGMTYTFEKSSDFDGGEHGNGLLTRFPILEEKHLLYRLQVSNHECSLMRLVLDVSGTEIVVMNTELNGPDNDSVQNANVAEIVAAANEYVNIPSILCGSFNIGPGSVSNATIGTSFQDCWTISGSGNSSTYPSTTPEHRFDYIFVSRRQVPTDTKSIEVSLKPVEARVLESNASDHLPLLIALKVVSE
jgi:endonuclease/exonuclease/phosphatase family metal-dependent hydrolase